MKGFAGFDLDRSFSACFQQDLLDVLYGGDARNHAALKRSRLT